MALDNINAIGPVRQGDEIKRSTPQLKTGEQTPTFKETLSNFMSEVNTLQNKADSSIEKMVAGEITDVHQVMNSVQEANLAFNMMMEIRNKVMDAYQEIMRLRL
jgi:flagellar hook-basal body complex protein FliE